jgi:hypothetical protein
MAPISGRNALATPRATSRPSLALHGLYFWVLALSATLTGHGDVAGIVDVGVAVAVQVLDHRHLGLAADALDQALAAARDDHVHVLGHGDQRPRPRGRWSAPAAPLRPAAGLHQRLLHQLRQRLVGFDRFRRPPPQDAGIAALDRQARRLDRHVGTALEDHPEDAERHAHLAHADAAAAAASCRGLRR